MFPKDTKILIVDDSLMARELLRQILELEGYTKFSEAKSGNSAMQILETNKSELEKIGLIMSDYNMPDGKGIELLKKVRLDAQYSKTHFIMVTAEGTDEVIEQSVAAGVDGMLIKPFSMESLMEMMKQVFHLDKSIDERAA